MDWSLYAWWPIFLINFIDWFGSVLYAVGVVSYSLSFLCVSFSYCCILLVYFGIFNGHLFFICIVLKILEHSSNLAIELLRESPTILSFFLTKILVNYFYSFPNLPDLLKFFLLQNIFWLYYTDSPSMFTLNLANSCTSIGCDYSLMNWRIWNTVATYCFIN